LSQADVFVLACVVARDGDRDGMPVALAEAMAMELPAISTDLVGIGELVRPGAGYLVPPNDAAALAQAIQKMAAAAPAERRKMGQVGRAIVAQDFEVFAGINRLADLFQQTVAPAQVKQ
jgi:glycosyltransferase involved in cell wall biosynthesis